MVTSSTSIRSATPTSADAPRRVTVLGATGSIGCNTIDLIDRDPQAYDVVALTANGNAKALAEQALRLRPEVAVVADPDAYADLKELLAGSGIEAAAGAEAVVEAAARESDWVMSAIVGAAGLAPTLAAVRRGGSLALRTRKRWFVPVPW